MEKKNNQDKIGAKKFFAWQSRAVSSACCVVILGYLRIYCTDQLALSGTVIGIILLLSNVVDAVTDLTAGYLVDRTKSRLGKGRPYELCILGVWLCTWLLYSCPPAFNTTIKIVWVFVLYIFVNSVFNTLLNSAATPYMVRAFKKGQLVRLASFGGLITMVGSMVVSISFPILMARLAVSAKGWSTLIAIYAVPLAVIGIMRFFFVKEEIVIEEDAVEKVSIKSIFTVLKKNPYIWMVALCQMLEGTVTSMGVGTYFYTYVVGNVEIMGMMMAISIFVIPLMFIVPALLKKMTKSRLILIGTALQVAGAVGLFLAGASIPVLVVASLIGGIGVLPITFLVDLQILDCCNYNEWKKLPRLEGSFASFRNFITKCGNGIGGLVLGVMLDLSGYVGGAQVQTDSAIMTIRLAMGIVPALMYAVVGILTWFYGRLDNQLPQIESDLAAHRANV